MLKRVLRPKRTLLSLGAVLVGVLIFLAGSASADEGSIGSAVSSNLAGIKSAYEKGDKDALHQAIAALEQNLDKAIDARDTADTTDTTAAPVTTKAPATTEASATTEPPAKNDSGDGGGTTANQGNVVKVGGTNEGAVNAAINSAQSGGTVLFPAGTYNVGRIGLKGGVLYKADGDVMLNGSDAVIFGCDSNCDGITIDGFTFNGGNVTIGSDGGTTNNLKVVNNTVKNIHAGGFSQSAGMFFNKLDDSTVSNNTLTDISGDENSNGLRFANPNRTTVSNNKFSNLYQGMTIDPEGANYGIDLVVSGNQMTNLERMGMEIQGDSTNMKVTDNKIGGFGSNGNQGIAMSLVTRGTGTVVTGNVLTNGGNVGLEILGNNVKVSGNTISNYRNGISVSCTPGGNYSGNTFSNIGEFGPFGRDGGYCDGETIGSNTVDGQSKTDKL